MTRLILIRHGETDYSREKRYCGFSNPSLNERGVWQSKRLAGKLKDIKVDKIYSSDLKRAHETAKIIFQNNLVNATKNLREIDFGAFEGLKYGEIIKKHSVLYNKWIDNPLETNLPRGEALKDLVKRVERFLCLICSKHKGGTVAAVTHEGPIRVILCKVKGIGLGKFWHVGQKIGALSIVNFNWGEAIGPRPQLII